MKTLRLVIFVSLLLLPTSVRAELPWQFDQHTRYMALGDSLAAGYGAIPATEGYVYLLYRSGVFDTIPNTLFNDAAVIGATSQQVLDYQVPQVPVFAPNVITLTVGGNDLLNILNSGALDPATIQAVLTEFGNNLAQTLSQLQTVPSGFPEPKIYVSNLYNVPEIQIPGLPVNFIDLVVQQINQIIEGVAQVYGVPVADVYSAFNGRKGLLLIERHGANQFEAHPTNAGHRVIAQAFEAVINQ